MRIKGFILIILIFTTAGCQSTARRTDRMNAPLEPGRTLHAQTPFGNITIQGDTGNECHITARVFAKAPSRREARDILAHSQAKLTATNTGLEMTIEHPDLPKNRSVGGELTIHLPCFSGINCQTDFGKIKVHQVRAGVIAKTDFGDIHCKDIAGRVDLKTHFGKVKAHHVESQQLTINSDFGDLLLVYSANTTNPLNGSLKTDFGSIKVYLPGQYGGQVKASTDFGSVRSLRPIQVKGQVGKDTLNGRIGNGVSHISAYTDFGSVRIH